MRLETLDRISLPNFSVRIMLSVLKENGLDANAALRQAGIAPAQIENVDGQVSGRQELNFQHAFVRQTGQAPKLWVSTGLRYNLLSYGTYGLLIATARTVRRAVELAGLFDDLHYSMMRYRPLQVDGELAGLLMDASQTPAALHDFCVFRALGSFSAIHRESGGGNPSRSRFEMTIAEPADARLLESMTGCRIRFGAARNAWLWQPESGDRELALGGAVSENAYSLRCQEIVERSKSDRKFVEQASSLLVRQQGRYLSSAQLAQACQTSERTLHRRLAEQGTSYRALLDQARYREAKDLLTDTRMTVAEIASVLGYSEVASLSRSFKRWSGQDPTSFRRSLGS